MKKENMKKIMLLSILVMAVFIVSACSFNEQSGEENNNNVIEQSDSQLEKIVNHKWTWIKTTKGEQIITPNMKNAFVVNFNEDMSVYGSTDCNGFFGDFNLNEDNISFGPLASTMMYCEGSQENVFVSDLQKVESLYFQDNDNLVLVLKDSEGEIEFQEKLIIHQPKEGERISSPLEIKGEARGTWFFEGSFSVILTDWDGKIIAEEVAQMDESEETWMTEELVSFTSMLEFENPVFEDASVDHFSRRGTLIFQKANPSGLAENDEAYEITVNFE